jgi:hypothetical protein
MVQKESAGLILLYGQTAEAIGDKRRPAGLMRGSETAPVVSVKIFVEEKIVPPKRIVGIAA